MQEHADNPTKAEVQKFVDDHFLPEGSEFEDWDPADWNKTIPLFNKIKVTEILYFIPFDQTNALIFRPLSLLLNFDEISFWQKE